MAPWKELLGTGQKTFSNTLLYKDAHKRLKKQMYIALKISEQVVFGFKYPILKCKVKYGSF